MAAYAALVSFKHIIIDIESHPSPPISLDKQQVQSLTEKLTFLQEFLESCNSPFAYSDEADPLEIRIADATRAVEDFIADNIHLPGDVDEQKISCIHDDDQEISCIHDDEQQIFCIHDDDDQQISCIHDDEQQICCIHDDDDQQICCIELYQDLQKVIEEMDLIKEEATEIMREKEQQQRNVGDARLRSSSTEKNSLISWWGLKICYFNSLIGLLEDAPIAKSSLS